LRVQGRIKEGPEDITLNSTHSIELSLNSEFKLEKEKWYDHHISRLKDAERLSLAPNAIICILDDEQANFGLVIPSGIKSIGEFALRLTKKRIKEKSQDDIKRVAEELIKISKEKGIEKIIVGSPMFWKDLVLKELQSRNPAIAKNTLLETVSTGSKRAFYELVASGSFDKIVQKSIASEEEKLVEQLLREISKDTGLYSYGLDEVQDAAKADAVENLLVSEKVADKDNKDWKAIRELIEKVEGTRGIIHIIDAESEAGKKLLGLGGIAALLRYKLR
jgi:protein pelota